jgi:hypothetical protein
VNPAAYFVELGKQICYTVFRRDNNMAKKEGKKRWGEYIPWIILFTIIGVGAGAVWGGWTGAVVGGILGCIFF